MSAQSVAQHVHDDVLVELLTEFKGQSCCINNGFGVVTIDVEDRGLNHPRYVRGVHRRTRVLRGGGESHLVVHDDVHCSAGAVTAQLGKVQGFGNNALAGESGITVHEQRQDVEGTFVFAHQVLLSPNDALQHRVDSFQVRWVSGQVHATRCATVGGEGSLGTQVVLHVT